MIERLIKEYREKHDLDLTALVRRNVMAEGQWQPGVLLLGRAPCLAVKYVKDREDKVSWVLFLC